MKKAYIKPEAQVVSFEADENLMSTGASGEFGWEEEDE